VEPVVQTLRRAVYPAPLPGNGGLLYAANPDSVDASLWWRPASGGTAQPLTTTVGDLVDTRVSADGRRVVATLAQMQQSLMFVPVSFNRTVEARPITDGYGRDLDPALDPKHNRIVFSSARSGNRNLWLARPDGSEPEPLTTERWLDERPAFSPDGEEIAFVSDRGGRRGIWVIKGCRRDTTISRC